MLDVLYKRRSIRKFKEDPVEQEKIDSLVKAALLAPSSRSRDTQRFIIVKDKLRLEQLSTSRDYGSAFLKNAPLAIVISGDNSLSDVWVEDTCIAASFLMITAQSLGLGSCWVQIRNRFRDENTSSDDYVKELLNIPTEFNVECILALGYPAEDKGSHTDDKLKYEKVFEDSFGNKVY